VVDCKQNERAKHEAKQMTDIYLATEELMQQYLSINNDSNEHDL